MQAGETPPALDMNALVPAPHPYNATAWATLEDVSSSGQAIEAVLMEYEPEGKEEKPAWGFLINPAVLEFENAANYGEVAPHATTVVSSQYSHTTGQTLTTPSMMFALWCYKKSARSLLEGLKKLLEANPLGGQFAPPLLRFSWGSYNVGPLSLLKYSYKVTAVLDGEPADVRDLTLTFKEQPRPLTQAEQEQRAEQRRQQAAEDMAARGGPRQPLTERQQEEAKTRARAMLTRNLEQFSPDVQAEIRANRYRLEVNAQTGLVTMLDASGKKLGVVSQFDSTNHKAGRGITTLPLRQGGRIAEGAIGNDGAIAPPRPAANTSANANANATEDEM